MKTSKTRIENDPLRVIPHEEREGESEDEVEVEDDSEGEGEE